MKCEITKTADSFFDRGLSMTDAITKTTFLLICLSFFHGGSALASEPIEITISGPTETVKDGSEIPIQILATNKSREAVNLPQNLNNSAAELNYSVTAIDEHGDAAPDTHYEALVKANRILIISRTVETLQPNASATVEKLLLNKLFVLTPGHTYTVQLKRQYPYQSGIWVSSNSIKIHIAN